MSVLTVDNLTKLYKNGRGVKNVSFQVEEGDVVGLLGPNGSGKTTIMKVIMSLVHGDSGNVEIFGNTVESDVEKALKDVGALIERPAIFEYLTARENMEMAARLYGKNVDSKRIDKVLEMVRISQYQKERCGRFSLGMKQRLGLALAVLSDPKLVVLDEPTIGLDIEGTVEIREIILAMAKERGTSFLIASHLAPELEKICNKVAVIHEGCMLSFDTIENSLKFNPTLEDFFLAKLKEVRGSVLV